MTMHPPLRKTEVSRWALGWGLLAGALLWGLVEFLALQRARWLVWRARVHRHAHR